MAWWPGGRQIAYAARSPAATRSAAVSEASTAARAAVQVPVADQRHRVVAVAAGPAVRRVRLPHRQPVEHAGGRKDVGHDVLLVLLVIAGDPLGVHRFQVAEQPGTVYRAQDLVAVGRRRHEPRAGRDDRVPDHRGPLRQLGAGRRHADPDLRAGHVRERLFSPDDGKIQHQQAPRMCTAVTGGYAAPMPRVSDLGITIGPLESGPTRSIADVPGVGVGHATVWRDEPAPPVGRGIARTGVTVIDPGGNLFREPIPAGGAVLNGAGECTGFITAQEWGLLETPIFLTSTMQLGRVYDAACELLLEEDDGIGEDVIIPVVAECDDSFLNDARRMQVTRDDVAAALAAARAASAARHRRPEAPAEGAVGSGTGMSCLGFKGGIGSASRLVGAHTLGVLTMTNFGQRERLTIDGVPVGRLMPAAPDDEPTAPDAGSCIVIVLTDAPITAADCQRLARRAGLGLARTGSVATNGSGEIFFAAATGLRAPRGTAPTGTADHRRRPEPVLRRGRRRDRGSRAQQHVAGSYGDRSGR